MSLNIENLSAAYREIPVLSDVNDTWPSGQITGVIGPNGAGKSTLLKAVAGLIPSQGTCVLSEAVLTKNTRRSQIAYMAQDTGALSSLTVIEVVLLGRLGSLGLTIPRQYRDDALQRLDAFGLCDLHTRTLDAISGGQRQLVYLAQALFRNPQVLLLDEPTAALDLRHQLLVLEHVRRYAQDTGAIVAVALHDLTLASHFSDRLVAIAAGGIFARGAPADVLTPELMQHLYGVEAEIGAGPSGRLHVVPTATSPWPAGTATPGPSASKPSAARPGNKGRFFDVVSRRHKNT